MKRVLLWTPFALAALLLGLMLARLDAPHDETIASQWVDKPMPAFNLPPATDGIPGLAAADLATGEPHLVNIFASWCVPCRVEAPMLETLRARGVRVVGIAIRDTPKDVASFLSEYGNPYARIGSDVDSNVQIAIGSSGVPESFLVDGKGIVREQIQGVILESDVDRIVAKMKAMR
ncbi:redoxin domain-containing protein [Sphingorhabdus soli]|uniref:Redoxin domain-containing protein n=1 Tax=Flavisphingopyxis soli TaxID=2601267 RepID=A0A5C6U838_9SPHN|nr:redoxin family protein [Sphingorhabdus soli]TXC68979.1 redoxin domain-containing protein [Sphingorhabdus soli]